MTHESVLGKSLLLKLHWKFYHSLLCLIMFRLFPDLVETGHFCIFSVPFKSLTTEVFAFFFVIPVPRKKFCKKGARASQA